MRQITKTVYTINEHPNKEKCFDWVRDNWYDLNEHSVSEVIDSLEALKNKIGGTLDYSIGQTPDRGEYITFKDYDGEILYSLDANDYPLTGVCWDGAIIEGLQKGDTKGILHWLHEETEYRYSNEGLFEHLETNEYEFNENGSFHGGE